MKLPTSKGRTIVIDVKTGKPKAKSYRTSTSAKIAARKKAGKPRLTKGRSRG